jgi:hypothetical protein
MKHSMVVVLRQVRYYCRWLKQEKASINLPGSSAAIAEGRKKSCYNAALFFCRQIRVWPEAVTMFSKNTFYADAVSSDQKGPQHVVVIVITVI